MCTYLFLHAEHGPSGIPPFAHSPFCQPWQHKGEEPDAGGDLGVGEELSGKGDHAFNKVIFRGEEGFPNIAFAAGIGGHGAIGEEERHGAIGREVMEHVLHPGEVGVALWRGSVFPAGVPFEFAVPPFLDVEGGIGVFVIFCDLG